MDHHTNTNGHQGPTNGYPPTHARRSTPQFPTVDQAMPFTPFSSIVPFNPAMIPTPTTLPMTSATAFQDLASVKEVRAKLHQLSSGARSAETASERCRKTLHDIQKLLNSDNLTKYNFKMQRQSTEGQQRKIDAQITKPNAQLSDFTKLVVESTHIPHRASAPTTKRNKPTVKLEADLPKATVLETPTRPSTLSNGHGQVLDAGAPAPQSSQLQAVVVASTLNPEQRAQYQDMSHAEAHPPTSQGRASGGYPAVSVDQKQKGDAAVQKLNTLLAQIFEAEDQMQPDTSDNAMQQGNLVFAVQDTPDGTIPVLQRDAQAALDSAMHKVMAIARLQSIDTDSLARIQKICERSVAAVETLNLRISGTWSSEDFDDWAEKASVAERGLIAARTLFRIMGDGAQVKELQSEDYLRTVLNAAKNVIEDGIVPLAEARAPGKDKHKGEPDGNNADSTIAYISANRQHGQTLLQAATKCLRTLGDFLTKCDVDESTLSGVEYMCKLLVFAENASVERESLLGTQNFETMRRIAMDILVKIFIKYREQRQFILDEILISLEKLPATKQSARQYRPLDAKPIQLVSALLMRLVQTSATYGRERATTRLKSLAKETSDEDSSDDASGEDDEDEYDEDEDEVKAASKGGPKSSSSLAGIVKPLHDAAQTHASYIVSVLTQRAMMTSKSSDEPYRRLLDIFTEDFINVLGSPDWPSAELLLRALTMRMFGMVESPKSAVPSRTLALEILGTIGAGIIGIQASTQSAVKLLEGEDGVVRTLKDEFNRQERGDRDDSGITTLEGSWRIAVEYIQARNVNDAQLDSALGFHLTQWAHAATTSTVHRPTVAASDGHRAWQAMITDFRWLDEHAAYKSVSTAQGRLSALLVTQNSMLCQALGRIFNVILTAMTSEHPTVKSRSLKSIVMLLNKDPTILDRNSQVLTHILRLLFDASPLVRDSALKLVGDCLVMRPSLDTRVYERVIDRTRDSAHGLRKRAINMLKEIYSRQSSTDIHTAITEAILPCVNDVEQSVGDIARQVIEDIMFVPLKEQRSSGEDDVKTNLLVKSQTSLFVRVMQANGNLAPTMEGLIKELATRAKLADTHTSTCKVLVHEMFESMASDSELSAGLTQRSILQCVAVFARAIPQVITTGQLERLAPYTVHLKKEDDLEVYRSAVTIIRQSLPFHPVLRHDFLGQLQQNLFKSAGVIGGKAELAEIAACLWTISTMTKNQDRLVLFTSKVLAAAYGCRKTDFTAEPVLLTRATRYCTIAGIFCNACDLDGQILTFKKEFPWYKGSSFSGLVVESVCPFTSPKRPLQLREAALDAVCNVAQAWPKIFLRSDVLNTFQTVFSEQNDRLVEVLLGGLEAFFSAQETSTEGSGVSKLGSGVSSGTERLGRTYVATDQDGASTSLAQRFLPDVLRVALSSYDEIAFTAAKLIISINRQGLVHPKESGPALVALETCPNAAIANPAFIEHRALHSKHETLFDKEYMRAVRQAFGYQKDTVGSTTGFTGSPPVAKLHLLWEVLKTGKAQVRKKFLGNLVQKMDFALRSFADAEAASGHFAYVRFCAENLAFLDYHRTEDLLHALNSLEKIFSGTGMNVAQGIEGDILQIRVDAVAGSQSITNGTTETHTAEPDLTASVPPARLHQLAVASQTCLLISETRSFIRRLWHMQKYLANPKSAAKDAQRAPTRATNAPSLVDAYLKRVEAIAAAGQDRESQLATCREFLDVISTDSEVKVASDNEDDGSLEMTGFDSDDGTVVSAGGTNGARGRKRKSVSVGGTPRKRRSLGKTPSMRLTEEGESNEGDGDGGWD